MFMKSVSDVRRSRLASNPWISPAMVSGEAVPNGPLRPSRGGCGWLAVILVALLGNAGASNAPAQDDSGKTEPATEKVNERSLGIPSADDPDPNDDAAIQAELEEWDRQMRAMADKYAAPPNAKQITQLPDLWIDPKAKRVYLDGYVTMRNGGLEMFACPVGTKEHESVVAAFAKSKEVHAALLALGTKSGTPVSYDPEFKPPTGQPVAVWVTWRDEQGRFKVADARTWVQNNESKESLTDQWVFAGSQLWTDPVDKVTHYSADSGDMICVSNFSSAMLDVPFSSSAQAGNLLFVAFTERIPEQATSVRLVLVPQFENDPNATTPPDETVLPLVKKPTPESAEKAGEVKAKPESSGNAAGTR
ncbi:YdjY domain-containing protein [Rhodopirellula sp. P2]|uniref:YdjY domain-containing protein n=1 Tax=Rhodopirellula sp. P2 TaxID=2127060 RepID=UPI00236844B4|nr:YdjY domain-containing protein [Rhodopirellula sp. P2]WDQ16103.1 YdjY domain-containing protein [Rhodopirellula sp. P2]